MLRVLYEDICFWNRRSRRRRCCCRRRRRRHSYCCSQFCKLVIVFKVLWRYCNRLVHSVNSNNFRFVLVIISGSQEIVVDFFFFVVSILPKESFNFSNHNLHTWTNEIFNTNCICSFHELEEEFPVYKTCHRRNKIKQNP